MAANISADGAKHQLLRSIQQTGEHREVGSNFIDTVTLFRIKKILRLLRLVKKLAYVICSLSRKVLQR